MEAEAGRQYRATIPVVARIIDVLQVEAGEDSPPHVCVVVTLNDIFPAVIERPVAQQEARPGIYS
jgi:hypothetical protein